MSIFGALPTEMARGGDAADAAAAAAPPRVASVVRSKTNFPRPRAPPTQPNPNQGRLGQNFGFRLISVKCKFVHYSLSLWNPAAELYFRKAIICFV